MNKEKIEFEITKTDYPSFSAITYVVLTIIFRSETNLLKEEVWTAECQELGTATFGDTYEETNDNIKEAISLHLDALDEVGERALFFKENGIHILRRVE